MITVRQSPSVNVNASETNQRITVTPQKPNTLTVGDNSDNLIELSESSPTTIIASTTETAVNITEQTRAVISQNTPSTVFKTVNNFIGSTDTPAAQLSELFTATEQILNNQIVMILPNSTVKVASSDNPDVMYSPLKIAKGNAAAGEQIQIVDLNGSHTSINRLESGKPVFLGINGLVTNNQSGVASIALGVATETNKFYARNGQRILLNQF